MRGEKTNFGKRTKYIAGIDGLRAIAVLMVLAYHLKLPFSKGGLLGVTVFFVISGFLITRILLSELKDTGTIDLKNFWIRRIRRLLPAVLTMAAVLILVSAIFNRVLFTKACSDLLSVIFCYNNWWQIFNNVSYFENAGAPSPLTHCWSLAIEAQFYLLYPLLLIFLSRFKNKKKLLAQITIILALISLALMWILFNPAKDPSRVYYGTDTRVFSLLFGAFLAIITQDKRLKKIPLLWTDAAGITALVGLLYMMVKIDGYSSFLYRGGQGTASLLTVIVIFSVLNRKSILGHALSIPPLKWTGDRSYGIYLWHYPVILLLSGGKKAAWWLCLIEILLIFLLSALSYHFIETPIRHGAIGNSIAIIRSCPSTRKERKAQIRTLKRSIKTVSATLIIVIAATACIAFVPRKSALSDIEKLEKQAEKADEIAGEKTSKSGKSKKSASKAQTDEEMLENLNLLLIGDSIILSAAEDFYETFPNSICDAAISRYTTESIDIYDSYVKEKKWEGDGVVFSLGTNGLLYDSLSTLREHMGPDMPLFIITARDPYASWEESNNAEMHEFAKSTDNTYLIDWYKISEGHPEYFDEDETHLVEKGNKAYIDCIKDVVLEVYKK